MPDIVKHSEEKRKMKKLKQEDDLGIDLVKVERKNKWYSMHIYKNI